MGVRRRIGWIVRGGAAIDALSADLKALQRNVETLTATVDDLRREQVRVSERQLDDLDTIRGAVAAATDDLVARINAIDDRTRSAT
ncbi:MAG: hypothetical protein AB7L17_14345 [Ilumatobacteraceae bacterium]